VSAAPIATTAAAPTARGVTRRESGAARMAGDPAHAESGAAPTAVIADDHPAIRMGVRMALMKGGLRVLAEAADRDGAINAVLRERPDLCLLDVYMPGGGIQAAATLAAVAPETAVVMLSVSDSTEDLLAALRAGAMGYLPKDTPPDRLPIALRGVLAGEPALPRALVAPVLGELRELPIAEAHPGNDGAGELSSREAEILRLLGAGMRTAEIGRSLSLSPITVRRHISAGVAKLGVADRREAIGAITAGLRAPRGRLPGPGYARPTSRRCSSRSA
jgi:DNA-binding NarL/FixJ family response regulator